MDNKYFFDKRVMKKVLIKYGCIFLVVFPLLLVINYYLNNAIKNFWLVILIDVVVVLFAILVVQLTINAIKKRKLENEDKPKVVKAKEVKLKSNKKVKSIEVDDENKIDNSELKENKINNKKESKKITIIKTTKK